ncbi:MAG: nuclear transport factor 2 family protein [Pirellulales bacterium]
MYATASLEAEVMVVLRELANAYACRDSERVLQLFSEDPDVLMLGSGQEEKSIGSAGILNQFQTDWQQLDTVRIRFGWRSVSYHGDVAWVATDCFMFVQAGYRQTEIPLRMTAVMIDHDGQWKISQLHLSSPVLPEEEVDTTLE